MNKLQKLKPGIQAREQFPIFSSQLAETGKNLVFLDSAASSQKPSCVIDRLAAYLSNEHANIHRGAYTLSAKATESYELARKKVAEFIGAGNSSSIIFTRGTTESINLVAFAGQPLFGDEGLILLTQMEHHSNIVPWQLLSQRSGLKVKFTGVDSTGCFNKDEFLAAIREEKPKIIAITGLSNALGTETPLLEIISEARKVGSLVLVDAAQLAVHEKINVEELDVDFLAFSGHKIYGPTGIGALYAKPEHLEKMQPYQSGGDMIGEVTTEGSTWAEVPRKFEAGTPAIAEAIALQSALEFMDAFDWADIVEHDRQLVSQTLEALKNEGGVTLYGPAEPSSIISFNVDGVHAHDLSTVADSLNVNFRAGHHCAMPLMKLLGINSSARVSFGLYNSSEDIPALIEAIRKAKQMLL